MITLTRDGRRGESPGRWAARRPQENDVRRLGRKAANNGSGLSPERPEGIIVLDLSLQPVAVDGGAELILQEMKPGRAAEDASLDLPPELKEILRNGRLSDPTSSESRLSLSNGQYSCRVFLMQPNDGFGEQPLLAIHLKKEVSIPEVVGRAAMEYGLTQREQEAVVGVCLGLTSRELADRMSISPNTVNAFLRTIMLKMGVTTRAGVVGKLLEENNSQQEA